MKIVVAEACFGQLLDEIADFFRQLQVVGDWLAAEFQFVAIVIELNRRLDCLDDDGIAYSLRARCGSLSHRPRTRRA